MSLSPQFLDELRARTSLSALIGRTVSIKKAGREWKGCCPFHGEKTPSFYVNDDKAFYHCFGCGAHGDAIRFLTDSGGLQFMDAVKELAAAAGMEIPASDPRQAERDRELTEMREIMARAARWFRVNYAEPFIGMGARGYVEQRGIEQHDVDTFDIGFAPSGRGMPRLSQHLVDTPVDKLIALGLVKRREEGERAGEIYDAFRGRLIFPIHDTRGHVIAFGGRIIGQGEPKYLNSPDTPLFDKGRMLFNLHRAAPAARKAGRLIVVEGYMDVVALYRAGVTEAVAPNGTALTEAQIALAWRSVDEPILCFDGDKAGRAAMGRAAVRVLPILEAGKSLAFVTPPAGQDPDDVLREQGPEAVQALFAKPIPLVDVLWQHELDAEPHDTPERFAGFKARMREHVRTIRSADVRDAYGAAFAQRFAGMRDPSGPSPSTGPQIRSSHTTERQPFNRRREPPSASAAQRQIGRAGIGGEIERAVLIGLIRFPDLVRTCGKVRFRDASIGRVLAVLAEYVWMNEIETEDQMRDQIEHLGMTDEVERLVAGRPLPFSFARQTPPPSGRADLEAALKAMTPK